MNVTSNRHAVSNGAAADGALVSVGPLLCRRAESLLWLGLLVVCNWPILSGGFAERLVFYPSAVGAGEWWRLLTHAFVHVTWYHLLLDGSAFVMLVYSLREASLGRRLAYVAAAGGGSLLAAWWAAPNVATGGFCGLSGVAHGLMAVSALELMRGQPAHSAAARSGLITFLFVAGKAGGEALSGGMLFSFLHFGLLGDPVAVSHAGGVIGALA